MIQSDSVEFAVKLVVRRPEPSNLSFFFFLQLEMASFQFQAISESRNPLDLES